MRVFFREATCGSTWLEVEDEKECGCGCSTLPCYGLAVRNQSSCTCSCPTSEITCPPPHYLSSHLCKCVCNNKEENTPCWWKHTWSEETCSCELQLNRNDYLQLTIFLISCLLLLLLLYSCFLRQAAKSLQVQLDRNTTYGLSLNLLRKIVRIEKPREQKHSNRNTR